jgi:hypothetical protein
MTIPAQRRLRKSPQEVAASIAIWAPSSVSGRQH